MYDVSVDVWAEDTLSEGAGYTIQWIQFYDNEDNLADDNNDNLLGYYTEV